MNNLTIAAQTIKDTISALDVGHAIGLNIDKHGRCSCPFHNGKDRNMKLFPGNRGYSCFVCHQGGDVISFVQQYYNMSFKDSIAWFNDTFSMGLDISGKIDAKKQEAAKNAILMRKRAYELEEWRERMQFNIAIMADRIVDRLEKIRDEKRPRRFGEEWNEDFCTAVVILPDARRFADDCMMDCIREK